jgi:hypothetical protein
MAAKKIRCDACGVRIRPNQHELVLADAMTGQVVGRYHAPGCQEAAIKYMKGGAVLMANYLHPDRCGPDQEYCDGGVSEEVA